MAFDYTTGQFQSGKRFVMFWDNAGGAAATQQIISRDNTTTRQVFQIYGVWLSCATGGNVAVFDGSDITQNGRFRNYSGGDVTIGTLSQSWDFGNDPLLWNHGVDGTVSNGAGGFIQESTAICVSVTGTYSGMIKYAWGS